MVKVRMNTADVAAEVKCLRRLIGMRCSNVYDLSPKTYVFKLMNSSGISESGESEKVLLLMESGVRLHTTEYLRDKSNTPSGFTLKLRRHIRTRRLEDVRQLGYDRIILFQFGLGSNAHYVILELYAQGNVILTDSEFMVLTLLRSHRDDDKGFAIMSRHRYPVEICRNFERTSITKLQEAILSLNEADNNNSSLGNVSENAYPVSSKGKQDSKIEKTSVISKNAPNGARSKQATLKAFLGEALGYGPGLSEHIIMDAGLVPSAKLGKDFKLDDNALKILAQAIEKFEDWLEDVISGSTNPEGYIIMQSQSSSKKVNTTSDSGSLGQIYDEFCPLLLNQFKSREFASFGTFDEALDEFYSKIESQRAEQQQKAKEGSAVQKLNKIRTDQENRVEVLKKEVDRSVKTAELIEYNLEDVDAAIMAVRVALANGMNWEDLARMVKEEKKSGNPVAALIDKLHLERNCITLLLSNNLDDMDEDEKTQPVDKVEVDLAQSAHANARRWYDLKKKQESKQDKTVTAHEKAFKAAEKKTRFQLSQEKAVATISHMRKVHWFEKFNWFISSENYLVVSGRDAQQNEMIVKRYMSKGDLYIHADLHGASSTVIKNHKPENPIPPLTLNQAGCFTVCHSAAWNSKIVTSAWWVYPHQVSKTAPTGEYLTVGSFMIRGKKNFLPPQPLVMGFGILFRLDESSLGSHLNERKVRGEEEEGAIDVEESEPLEQMSDSESENDNSNGKPASELESVMPNTSDSGEAISHASYLEANSFEIPVVQVPTSLKSDDNQNISENSGNTIDYVHKDLEDLMDRALELGPASSNTKDHVLHSPRVDLGDEQIQEENKQSLREKPYVSKAERRKLKKGPKNDFVDAAIVKSQRAKEDNLKTDQLNKNADNLKPGGTGKISRGQRNKLKKIKEKYADQDEEERSIRMALLASTGKAQVSKGDPLIENATAEKTTKPSVEELDAPKICYKCKKAGHLSRDCQDQPENASQDHKNVSATRARSDDANNEMMDKVEMDEDDINEIGEEEKEKLNDVDYLTGIPLPNDILLYAVPVCGPYNALQQYKYRVKIIPGTAKRGKGAKTAMNLFSHMGEATQREKELMKACTDPELVAAIIGNVKITASGLTQLKQKQKKGKKSNKQNGGA
ncbi:ribosome quality control complex subunit NEMF isoform X2 [Impatiens glandulifera]|uniref:ribosome quality control complex subunit NEMF isoform X2 n=1 Tax=Impatiens glandulifera TaxID=253017 RepID=UPI001FB0F869|nr:ribosome quality control complex subunit NEMF isoform X2 [Impatiens glandulifera]